MVGLGGADSVALVEEDGAVGASGVSVGVVIIGAGTGCTITGAVGIAAADVGLTGLTGLTGLSTLVGLVTDFTQVFDDVTHEPQTGAPYGLGQALVMVCVIDPVYPA